MKRIFNRFLFFQRRYLSNESIIEKDEYTINFDDDKEILENYVGKVMLLGINLPDQKNLLTESAVDSLTEALNKFYCNDELISCVLYGRGGNFCTGLVASESALKKGYALIETLHNGTKPVLCALNGSTLGYGFQLALMCDLRAMDASGVLGLGRKKARMDLSPFVQKRLMQILSLPNVFEIILTNSMLSARKAEAVGLSNATVDIGSSLSQVLNWGQSISLCPLESVVKTRSNIMNFLTEK